MAETTPPASGSGADAGQAPGMQVDAALVRQLAELLDATRLTEIEVQDGDRRIRVARNVVMSANVAPGVAAAAPPSAPAPPPAGSPAPPAAAAAPGEHPGTVRSPMVGTAYLGADPAARPFAALGDRVEAGDTLLIVEAMKVMNPILSPRAGTIRAVFVESGQPVEFDQPLIVVE